MSSRTFAATLRLLLLVWGGMGLLPLCAQPVPGFRLEKNAVDPDRKMLSNTAIELMTRRDTLLLGGAKGLDLSPDRGRTWRHIGQEAPFEMEDVAAVDWYGSTLWCSLAGSENSLPVGRGLAVSVDNGATWKRVDQPMEAQDQSVLTLAYGNNAIKMLAVTTPINNITYDLAVTSRAVWIASFAGGLRKSIDGGKTFTPVILPPDFLDSISPADTLAFDLSPVDRPDLGLRGNLNHRVFSVHAENDSVIWVGTAGGINRSSDGGVSWRRFSATNQSRPISGNFVVALGSNTVAGRKMVWASTINALDAREFRAISFTSDEGNNWSTALRGEFTHNFGFRDSIAYAVSNEGVWRSDDGGRSWLQFNRFVDPTQRQQATSAACYAAASMGDSIWVAGDGLFLTVDNATRFFGSSWSVYRAFQPVGASGKVYAYPNPFSPADDVCRVHYRTDANGSVSIRIYDFAMMPVRTLLRNAARPPDSEQDEIWNGRDDGYRRVANGLYYIEVTVGSAEPRWGKVVVLQ